MTKSLKKTAAVAMMAAVLCVCSWLTIPFTIPFTMQTFGVFCALLLLGGRDGTIAVALYLLLGAVGLPVFSGFRGGVGHLLGPTGGYLVGFLLSGLFYWILEAGAKKRFWLRVTALAGGLLLCYAAGTVWFAVVAARGGEPRAIGTILSLCVLPYLLPDAAKLALALFVCGRVKKSAAA